MKATPTATTDRAHHASERESSASSLRRRWHPEITWWSRWTRISRDELRQLHPRRILAQVVANRLPHFALNYTRTALLRAGGLRIAPRALVMGPLIVTGEGDWSKLVSVGSGSIISGSLHIDLGARVTIGDFVHIGHHVLLLTIDHEIGPPERRCGANKSAPIVIGNGAWIAARVTILPGVTVGAGSVVAAGSVVTTNVPPNTLVAGVPARIVRKLDGT